jgi:hypothetical protein
MRSMPAFAEYDAEVLLFPFIETAYLSDLPPNSVRDNDESDYGLNFFAAIENQQFVFLGEALVGKDEQEVERLQFGWRIGETRTWLGRFHNPIGYWNTRFHHGAYLQPSVARPSFVEFEDDGGILPMHLAGLLVEGTREYNNKGLGYAFALATGPELGEDLEALDVFSPNSTSGGLALALNIFRQPVIYGPTQYGLFANYTEIPAPDRGINEIRQVIAGGYWNWESSLWRLIGSAAFVQNRFEQPNGDDADDFVSAYFHAERFLTEKWSIFGRLENTFASDNDAYLALFPDYALEKFLGGVTLNLSDRHLLRLEVSANKERDDRYRSLTLQWAAMF